MHASLDVGDLDIGEGARFARIFEYLRDTSVCVSVPFWCVCVSHSACVSTASITREESGQL